jgi:hypothetical protein
MAPDAPLLLAKIAALEARVLALESAASGDGDQTRRTLAAIAAHIGVPGAVAAAGAQQTRAGSVAAAQSVALSGQAAAPRRRAKQGALTEADPHTPLTNPRYRVI